MRLSIATLLAAVLWLPAPAQAQISATDRNLVPIYFGSTLFAMPEAWIDRGYLAEASAGALDTLLLTPPVDAFVEGYDTPGDYQTIAILLRHDPNGDWRDLYVDRRIAAAEARFGIASPEDAAVAFEGIRFDALYGGPAASSGKAASRARYFGGTVATDAYGIVSITADVGGGSRLYSISASIRSRDMPVVLAITLRTNRPLEPGDLGLIDVAMDTVNGRFDLTAD